MHLLSLIHHLQVPKKVFDKFKLIYKKLNHKNIKLCQDDINLELEMLYEKKHLIGPQSSIERYAISFGSSYKKNKSILNG